MHSFVLQVPESAVTRDRKPSRGAKARNAVVGVWATTERRRVSVLERGTQATTAPACRSAASATR